jgi:hypothetical protein
MILILLCAVFALVVLYTGFKFYRSMDWDERADFTPDLSAMRKREAELMHVQDVLQEACDQGKLSKSALEEYILFAEAEMSRMEAVRQAWEERHRSGR